MTEIILYKLGTQRVNKHFMNPRKCLNMREKGNTCIEKLTLVQICFSIHLLWFRLMLPLWETWQRSYHFRGSPIHPFLSFSHGPYPRVSSSLLWLRLPNWPLPLSILFIHINPPCRLEERDYWSMDLMLKNTVILHCPRHMAQAPRCGFQRQASQRSRSISRSSSGCLGNSRPRLLTCGSQHTGVSCHCKYGTICD